MRRRAFLQSAAATVAAVSIPRRAFATAFRIAPRRSADVEAITGDGVRFTLAAAAIADLKARLRGGVLLAGDPGYDTARMILNPSFDKRPALVVQPTGAADIREAVNFARENRGLLLAVNSNAGVPANTRLVTINLGTGKISNIGTLPDDTDALAFTPELRPTELSSVNVQTLALLVLGAIALILGLIGWAVGRKPRA